ncbi:hypothetical protein Hanom_Chr14g01284851 [Helianthus anomalus]
MILEQKTELVFIFLTFNLTLKVTFISNFQEPHKLLQPVDKTLKTMAIELLSTRSQSMYFLLLKVMLTLLPYPSFQGRLGDR